KKLKILTPAHGSPLIAGGINKVTWQADGVEQIKLSYALDGESPTPTFHDIATVGATPAAFDWAAPCGYSNSVILRIADASTPTARDSGTGLRLSAVQHVSFFCDHTGAIRMDPPVLLAGTTGKVCADGADAEVVTIRMPGQNVAGVRLRIKEDPGG